VSYDHVSIDHGGVQERHHLVARPGLGKAALLMIAALSATALEKPLAASAISDDGAEPLLASGNYVQPLLPQLSVNRQGGILFGWRRRDHSRSISTYKVSILIFFGHRLHLTLAPMLIYQLFLQHQSLQLL
jgi:hypothetical protein